MTTENPGLADNEKPLDPKIQASQLTKSIFETLAALEQAKKQPLQLIPLGQQLMALQEQGLKLLEQQGCGEYVRTIFEIIWQTNTRQFTLLSALTIEKVGAQDPHGFKILPEGERIGYGFELRNIAKEQVDVDRNSVLKEITDLVNQPFKDLLRAFWSLFDYADALRIKKARTELHTLLKADAPIERLVSFHNLIGFLTLPDNDPKP
ncbi:hypothetical protein HY384_04415 [Candidatus Daviesbacteria bacterium]|nr:hypothetical protein [Candidatus Daviesbacteria bacterium]